MLYFGVCFRIRSLFDSVLTICGLPEQQAQSGLRTSFTGMRSGSDEKYLMVKREFEDSFETFLEIIDLLPCWEMEDGRCIVFIDVVMA